MTGVGARWRPRIRFGACRPDPATDPGFDQAILEPLVRN